MKINRLAVIFFAAATALSAQTTSDLTGKWKISWFLKGVGNGEPNVIVGTEDRGWFTGVYTSDDGEPCPTTGTTVNSAVQLTVSCKEWKIWLTGKFTDNDTVKGDYAAPAFSNGQFVMDRKICLLPEGCK